MTTFRSQCRKLSRILRDLIDEDEFLPNEWKDGFEGLSLSITQRRFRIFDCVNVCYEGVPIWLPLVQRTLIRRAMRKAMVRQWMENVF